MTLQSDMVWEKRPLERKASEEGFPEGKRQRVPALASVIVEAVKMDSLQKLCSTLEPLLRKVVGEEVERALSKLAPARLGARSPPKMLQGSNNTSLRLQFQSKLALPLFTGSKIEGDQGSAIHVVLQDACTGQVVTSCPEASAKLEVVVLEGDFSIDEEEDWTQEEFDAQELRERDGKRPLLTGDLTVSLKEGMGTLGELTFTDNSSWLRSRKFRLGVKIAAGFCEGARIREAKTDAFTVKDHRGELYKKHYPPALHDEVWRLDKIGKDGAFHKRLNNGGVCVVEDFLRLVVMDPQKLRHILGSGMSSKMWEGTVEHAKTCVLSGKLFVYYADDKHNIGVIFNNIFQLMWLIAAGQYMSVDALSDSEKLYVDKLVKEAYDNWERVVEYDGEALIATHPKKQGNINADTPDTANTRSSSSQRGHTSCAQDQAIVPSSQPAVVYQTLNCPTKGADVMQGESLSDDSQNPFTPDQLYGRDLMSLGMDMSLSLPGHSVVGSMKQENMMMQSSTAMIGLPTSSLQGFTSPVLPYHLMNSAMQSSIDMWNILPRYRTGDLRSQDSFSKTSSMEEHYSEEELHMKSLELLAHEDFNLEMQQLAYSNYNLQGDFNFYPAFAATPEAGIHFQSSQTTHTKANIGWLKLKAALRWGIFIRKRAAARRAHLQLLQN